MILLFLFFNILFHIELYRLGPSPISHTNIVQSHSLNTLDNRRLSLAALPVVPAASRGVKLPLLVNTRCFLVQFQSNSHAHGRTFAKRRRLAFIDCDYC